MPVKCQVCGSPDVTKIFVCVRCSGDVPACLGHEDDLGGLEPVCKSCEDTKKHSLVPPRGKIPE